MAPWAKDYTPKMEDIQTRLRIIRSDHIDNKDIYDYRKLFISRRSHQILIKGGWGSGKTLLSKKLAFDWATGMFKTFIAVFVVPTVLVSPSTPIENAMAQHCNDEGLQVSEQTVEQVLAKYRERILIIVDEYDGDTSEMPTNQLSIRKMPDFLKPSVIVTSGPCETWAIENEFQTVCEIQSFRKFEREAYLPISLKKEVYTNAVLSTDVEIPSIFFDSNQCNPMLIMFLCLLVDTMNGTLWEIYLNIVLILCREGSDTLKTTGRYAWNLLLKKVNPGKGVNITQTDLGLFSSHSRGDSLRFPHSTIRVFFGALYFILMLDEGQTVHGLLGSDCEEPIFLFDQLFLYFCLSLLKNPSSLRMSNTNRIEEKLQLFVVDKADNYQLDLTDLVEMYPALKVALAKTEADALVDQFLVDVLRRCRNVKHLVLGSKFSFQDILVAMQPTLSNLRKINIGDYAEPTQACIPEDIGENEIHVVTNNLSDEQIETLLL